MMYINGEIKKCQTYEFRTILTKEQNVYKCKGIKTLIFKKDFKGQYNNI